MGKGFVKGAGWLGDGMRGYFNPLFHLIHLIQGCQAILNLTGNVTKLVINPHLHGLLQNCKFDQKALRQERRRSN